MKKTKVHNLDTLEREIYRLKLEAKNIETLLDKNAGYLQRNFTSMMMNSICRKQKTKEEERHSFFDSVLKNEKLNNIINKMSGHIADRAAEGIESLLNKIFHSKK
jgi:hypothetical protein